VPGFEVDIGNAVLRRVHPGESDAFSIYIDSMPMFRYSREREGEKPDTAAYVEERVCFIAAGE